MPPRRIEESTEFERSYLHPQFDKISLAVVENNVVWDSDVAISETNMYFKKTRNTRIKWREGLYYSSAQFLFETPLQKIRWEQRRCYFFANILLAILSTFVLPFVAYVNVKPPWCHDQEVIAIKTHMGWLIEGHIDDTRPLEQIKTFILETGRFAFTPAIRGDEFLLLAGMECRQEGQAIKSRSLVLISIKRDGSVDREPDKHYENETKERKDGVDFVHPFPEPAGQEIQNASGSAGGSAAAPSGGVGGGDEGQVEGAVTSPGTGGGRGRGRTGGGAPSPSTGGGRAMGRTGGDVASPGTFGGRGSGQVGGDVLVPGTSESTESLSGTRLLRSRATQHVPETPGSHQPSSRNPPMPEGSFFSVYDQGKKPKKPRK